MLIYHCIICHRAIDSRDQHYIDVPREELIAQKLAGNVHDVLCCNDCRLEYYSKRNERERAKSITIDLLFDAHACKRHKEDEDKYALVQRIIV